MIERVIHQIWHPITCPEMPRDWQRFARGWKRFHPNHRYMLWGIEESRNFVAALHPEFLPVYDAYSSPGKRVASLRYLLLESFGGVVADLDLECLRNVDELLEGRQLVLSVEPVSHWPQARREKGAPVLSTAFLASESHHAFWHPVIEELRSSAGLRGLQEAAGILLLTRCYDAAPDRTTITLMAPEAVNPVDAEGVQSGAALDLEGWMDATSDSYAVHHWAGTWNRPGPDPLPAPRPFSAGLSTRLHHPAWRKKRPDRWLETGPLVSCIMVTRGWSYPARWAIESFRQQSYTNRELVVATTNGDGDLARHVESLCDPRIRLLDVLPAGTPLGAQRNLAVQAAKGELITTWDDDDLYGADRIAALFTAMASSGAAAAFLERISVWWPARQHLAVTSRRTWENSMLVQRKVMGAFPEIDRGEDTQVVDRLVAQFPVVTVDDPNLYVYVVWGTNTWGSDHFQRILQGATLEVQKRDYDRGLSVMNRHVPILEYLAWLQTRDPKSFDPPADSPAPLASIPVADDVSETARPERGASRLVPAASSVSSAEAARRLRFLFAWEIGAGFGHTVPLAQIARPLLEAGHEVHLALRDLTSARAALGRLASHQRLRIWQSPHWSAPFHATSDPTSYPEILFRAGFLDAHRLMGVVDAWDTLFRQVEPDLLLAEHAPTALLSARGHRFPRAVVGSGFFIPQLEVPIPSFRDWEPIPQARVEQAEERVLTTCNTILAAKGLPLLAHLRDLLTVDEQFLITVPELDYYERRSRDPSQRYYGTLPPATHGQPAQWPSGTEPQVFAYLRGEYRSVEQALLALSNGPWRVLAFVPGLGPAITAKVSSSKLLVLGEPVDMAEVCNSCSAVVCNSGSGTVSTLLHAGKPLVMLPLHLEQFLIARRVMEMGAGLVVLEERIEGLADALKRVLTQTSFREAALGFSRRYACLSGNRVADTVAARCVDMARLGRSSIPAGGRRHERHRSGRKRRR